MMRLTKFQKVGIAIIAVFFLIAIISGDADSMAGAMLITFFVGPILLIGPYFLETLRNPEKFKEQERQKRHPMRKGKMLFSPEKARQIAQKLKN